MAEVLKKRVSIIAPSNAKPIYKWSLDYVHSKVNFSLHRLILGERVISLGAKLVNTTAKFPLTSLLRVRLLSADACCSLYLGPLRGVKRTKKHLTSYLQ